jgi:hypothetical protein
MIDALFGLIMAPLFSALALVAGVAHLQTFASTSPDPIVEWFAALAVMGLVTFIPAMIVPALGSIFHSVSSAITGAVSAGTVVGGIVSGSGMRLASGVFNTMQGMRNIAVSGIDLARSTVGSISMADSTRTGRGLRGTTLTNTQVIERNFQPTPMGHDRSGKNTPPRDSKDLQK